MVIKIELRLKRKLHCYQERSWNINIYIGLCRNQLIPPLLAFVVQQRTVTKKYDNFKCIKCKIGSTLKYICSYSNK